jgi:hypothetical protein
MGFQISEEVKEFNIPISDDKYFVFSANHLQTAFYLLILGYVLAGACFVTENMWHHYSSKGRERTSTSLCHR